MSTEDWLSQTKRGLLELALLALIGRGEMYGYEIVATLADKKRLSAPEGTVYPILRRLKKDGLLTTRWEPSESGPPRQYYSLSARGQSHLKELRSEWHGLSAEIDKLLKLREGP